MLDHLPQLGRAVPLQRDETGHRRSACGVRPIGRPSGGRPRPARRSRTRAPPPAAAAGPRPGWPPAPRARPAPRPAPRRPPAPSSRSAPTSPPPTMESARSSFRPGTAARRFAGRAASRVTISRTLLRLQQVPVQAGDGVAAPALIDLGQVPHGAAGAHQRRPRRQALQARLAQACPARAPPAGPAARCDGGSEVRKASDRRSDPSGKLQAPPRRRARNRQICMLPPPTSNWAPCSTGSPRTAPRNPACASSGPERMRSSMPSSLRTVSSRAGPLVASRTAEVATATVRRAPLPTAMARKSCSASSVRLIAWGLRALPFRSRTSRNDARLLARMGRCPLACTSYTTTRPEFDPMSMTATGPGGPNPNRGRPSKRFF